MCAGRDMWRGQAMCAGRDMCRGQCVLVGICGGVTADSYIVSTNMYRGMYMYIAMLSWLCVLKQL